MSAHATVTPPFEIPNNFKSRAGNRWAERALTDVSDGEANKWPVSGSGYRPCPPEFYLCHLGQKWAEVDGIAEAGINYYIGRFPAGYALFEIDQPGGSQVYKRLFGHPSGRFYDSTVRFEVHFLWLMSGMVDDCTCVLCATKTHKPMQRRQRMPREMVDKSLIIRARRPDQEDDTSNSDVSVYKEASGLATQRARRTVKQTGAPFAEDEEGNEDIYKDCIRKTEVAKGDTHGIEITLSEENSIDWKAEQTCLPQHLTQIEQQHSFVPRRGELVLWCPSWPGNHHLLVDPATLKYRWYSFKKRSFVVGRPSWRAGIVASVPTETVKNGPIDFPDILDCPSKLTALNTAGFRIETMPDPNNDTDKSMSKQYRWRFRGDWPHGHIYCRGIYLGSELITVGDTVRLAGPSNTEDGRDVTCTDVMVVTSIRYNIVEMRPEHALATNPVLSSKTFISFVGQAYTTDVNRAHGAPFREGSHINGNAAPSPTPLAEIKQVFRPVGSGEYGPWYSLHGPKHKFEVSHEHILGRLYEADAVRLWTGQRQFSGGVTTPRPSLDFDADAIVEARHYATATDERLEEPPDTSTVQWFLADTRAQALAIETLNGLEVGAYHDVRDKATLKQWRNQVKMADGREIGPEAVNHTDMIAWKDVGNVGAQRGRPAGSKVINGKLYLAGQELPTRTSAETREVTKPSSQMAGAALASDGEESESPDSDSRKAKVDHAGSATLTTQHAKSAQPSKSEIMSSVGTGIVPTFGDDTSSDGEEGWWNGSQPLLRGGTEEGEGGDYRG